MARLIKEDSRNWSSSQIKKYEKLLNNALSGKTVYAFGSLKNRGLWGFSDEKSEFVIQRVQENDKYVTPKYGTINIFLKGYNIDSSDDLIYTDPTFLKNIRALLNLDRREYNSIDYSEQGMQGRNYVNMDTTPEVLMNALERLS